ncbi:Uncharacterised protein [Chryseobacterium indologenes]|nr:Uncharacterised protein [Chryseobacterium indologenes]
MSASFLKYAKNECVVYLRFLNSSAEISPV